jgi:predicted secreted protein
MLGGLQRQAILAVLNERRFRMSDNKKDVEVTIEESVEQLEEKVAPAAHEKIILNHNETLVRDHDENEKL